MIWLAQTSSEDGIAIVVFATVIFLSLFGIGSLVKWIFRMISGKPKPAKMESVVVVLQTEICQEDEELKDHENVRIFAFYLHSKLAEKKIGQLANSSHEDSEHLLYFAGPDARGVWNVLEEEVKAYSPKKPKRVILERTKKNGGVEVLDHILWEPGRKLDFQIPQVIPESWRWRSIIARRVLVLAYIGLFGWNAIRFYLGKTEAEFMDNGFGMFSAYLIGAALIFGLSLGWICGVQNGTFARAAGFLDAQSSMSITLKYVFLTVIAIFGLLLQLT